VSQTPLEFFGQKLGETNIEKIRSYIGRFGITGDNQSVKCVSCWCAARVRVCALCVWTLRVYGSGFVSVLWANCSALL
jgi:hypothetical protein